jgi:hypothetical protein
MLFAELILNVMITMKIQRIFVKTPEHLKAIVNTRQFHARKTLIVEQMDFLALIFVLIILYIKISVFLHALALEHLIQFALLQIPLN